MWQKFPDRADGYGYWLSFQRVVVERRLLGWIAVVVLVSTAMGLLAMSDFVNNGNASPTVPERVWGVDVASI